MLPMKRSILLFSALITLDIAAYAQPSSEWNSKITQQAGVWDISSLVIDSLRHHIGVVAVDRGEEGSDRTTAPVLFQMNGAGDLIRSSRLLMFGPSNVIAIGPLGSSPTQMLLIPNTRQPRGLY